MAHWNFRGQRSFGSISCRGKQRQSDGDLKNTHFSFRKVNKRDKTNPSLRPSLLFVFWPWLWNSQVMLTNRVRQLLEMLREGGGTFGDCSVHSSWLGIHKLPNQSKLLRRGCTTSELVWKLLCLSVHPSVRIKLLCPSYRLYAFNKSRTTSNEDTAFDPTNWKINTK
jgi:hypothetical protein